MRNRHHEYLKGMYPNLYFNESGRAFVSISLHMRCISASPYERSSAVSLALLVK